MSKIEVSNLEEVVAGQEAQFELKTKDSEVGFDLVRVSLINMI